MIPQTVEGAEEYFKKKFENIKLGEKLLFDCVKLTIDDISINKLDDWCNACKYFSSGRYKIPLYKKAETEEEYKDFILTIGKDIEERGVQAIREIIDEYEITPELKEELVKYREIVLKYKDEETLSNIESYHKEINRLERDMQNAINSNDFELCTEIKKRIEEINE